MAIGIQMFSFLFASGLFGNPPTEKYYDLTGSITYFSMVFLCVMNCGLVSMDKRQMVLALCTAIWCTRLGAFLFTRIKRHGGVDFRFATVKLNFHRFSLYWGIQGVWVFVTALPVWIVLSQESSRTPWGTLDSVGLAVWAAGFAVEVLADHQKHVFSVHTKPALQDREAYISTGLWKYSRHPNCKCLFVYIYMM